jgi:mRNA-degrading endonuclease YafQ of YafQ-DinJ toxin-antitoxin module
MPEARFTEQFIKATKKEDIEKLTKVLEDIAASPYTAQGSHKLSHDWAGFRAANFAQGKRIIYRVCGECIQNHQRVLNPLSCCLPTDEEPSFVTFVDFGDYHACAGRRRLRPASTYPISEPNPPDEES